MKTSASLPISLPPVLSGVEILTGSWINGLEY
jgi:hypothetical protein